MDVFVKIYIEQKKVQSLGGIKVLDCRGAAFGAAGGLGGGCKPPPLGS